MARQIWIRHRKNKHADEERFQVYDDTKKLNDELETGDTIFLIASICTAESVSKIELKDISLESFNFKKYNYA